MHINIYKNHLQQFHFRATPHKDRPAGFAARLLAMFAVIAAANLFIGIKSVQKQGRC